MLYGTINGEMPRYMRDMLIRNSDIHQRVNRYNQFNYVCSPYNRKLDAGQSFVVQPIKAWNNLPQHIRQSPSLRSFRVALFMNAFSGQLNMSHF